MNHEQMVNYLYGQLKHLERSLLMVKNSDLKERSTVLARLSMDVEFIKGYATCLEHEGALTRETADVFFETIAIAQSQMGMPQSYRN